MIASTGLQAKRKFVTIDGLQKQRTNRRLVLEKSATDHPEAEAKQANSKQVLPKVINSSLLCYTFLICLGYHLRFLSIFFISDNRV